MLQIELKTYASDALEDAMRLAQTKALNSYSWSDMLSFLNYIWSDCYNRIAMIDDGYYSTTVRLNTAMTKLPPFVKNTIRVYSAQDPVGFNRQVYRASGMNDLRSSGTYHISGFDLYCPDAVRRTMWLNYVPTAPMLFFTMNNRDPKLYDYNNEPVVRQRTDYGMYTLVNGDNSYWLKHKSINAGFRSFDLSRAIKVDSYKPIYIDCDFPYIFVTYQRVLLNATIDGIEGDHTNNQRIDESPYRPEYLSGFYYNIQHNVDFIQFNPFDYTGRDSNVEYIQTSYNDKTGMGVIVRDHNDFDDRYFADHNEKRFRVKELGYTPDTVLVYPCPEMYRYVVALLADKLASINQSDVMAVQSELISAKYAFEAFCARDKSAFGRIDNVNGPSIGDWL